RNDAEARQCKFRGIHRSLSDLYAVTLRCERSEPRRATAAASRPGSFEGRFRGAPRGHLRMDGLVWLLSARARLFDHAEIGIGFDVEAGAGVAKLLGHVDVLLQRA